jgi:hypothetical protein
MQHPPSKQTVPLQDRIASFAREIREKAFQLSPGKERDDLLRRARQRAALRAAWNIISSDLLPNEVSAKQGKSDIDVEFSQVAVPYLRLWATQRPQRKLPSLCNNSPTARYPFRSTLSSFEGEARNPSDVGAKPTGQRSPLLGRVST